MYILFDLPILLILGCGFCWLCVYLWFLVLVETFFGWSFPAAGYLRVSLSPTLVFCCAGVGRLCWRWLFRVYKVLMFFSCSCSVVCSHYLVVSPDRSWVELVRLPLPPSPSSVFICWRFLWRWVSSSRRNPGVPSFYPLFFYGRPSLGYGCVCRAFLDLHSPWFLWSQLLPR